MVVVTKEQCKTGFFPPDYYGRTCLSASREASVGPGVVARPQKQTLNHRELQAKGVCVGEGGGVKWGRGTHIKIAFMNLCFSTNKWNGVGTLITGELLQANQKWNKL